MLTRNPFRWLSGLTSFSLHQFSDNKTPHMPSLGPPAESGVHPAFDGHGVIDLRAARDQDKAVANAALDGKIMKPLHVDPVDVVVGDDRRYQCGFGAGFLDGVQHFRNRHGRRWNARMTSCTRVGFPGAS